MIVDDYIMSVTLVCASYLFYRLYDLRSQRGISRDFADSLGYLHDAAGPHQYFLPLQHQPFPP